MLPKRIKPVVIKYGGSLVRSPAVQKHFFKNIARLSRRQGIVIVHGGGAAITACLNRMRIRTRFVRGLRFTNPAAMDAVEMVLSGGVNKQIVAGLNACGARAAGISARDNKTIVARRIPSLGRVGTPHRVNPKLLNALLDAGFIPVVSPVGCDRSGHALNINADEAACAIAVSMKAQRLVYLTDVPGILNAKGKRIPRITVGESKGLGRKGIITGGMIPKLASAVSAIQRGVHEVDILQGGNTISFSKGTRVLP